MNDEKFNNHSEKTQSHIFESIADHERKHKKKPGQIKPRKRHRKCEFDKSFSNSNL